MTRPRQILLGALFAVVLVIVGAIGVARFGGDEIATESDAPVVAPAQVAGAAGPSADTLDGLIEQLQTRLEAVPGDHVAWSTLGLAYVQQARITADPSLYPRAEGALDESLAVNPDDNFLAFAGLSALASARHEFADAKDFAERGLAINDFSSILWGALSDAELQLGNYDAADAAVERMLMLSPDTSSYSRASYLAELRGETDTAAALMTDAFEQAFLPTDRAFALAILGDLAFDRGDPNTALEFYNDALVQAPDDAAAKAGKARSEAALGQIQTALDTYGELVAVAPEPSYLIAYGKLLESIGGVDEADEQFAVVDAVQRLFEENGVELDAEPILFLADHGEPERALTEAEQAVATRPFLAIHDAHAWALYQNGQHEDALLAIDQALQLGSPDASFLYHSGEIKLALGDDDGARADLARALEINPYFDPLDAPRAEQVLADLDVAT